MVRSHDSMFFSSMIDLPQWDRAKWRGTGFGRVAPDQPPFMALVYEDPGAGREVFRAWRARFGPEDKDEAIRVVIVEGDAPGKEAGYSVKIGTEPGPASRRAREQGLELPVIGMFSRLNRMNPAPGSPHLRSFKEDYRKFGAYALMPGGLMNGGFAVFHEVAIVKRVLHFRDAQSIKPLDIDCDALLPG